MESSGKQTREISNTLLKLQLCLQCKVQFLDRPCSVQSILIKLCSCVYFSADCLASLNEYLYYNQCSPRLAYLNMQSSYMSWACFNRSFNKAEIRGNRTVTFFPLYLNVISNTYQYLFIKTASFERQSNEVLYPTLLFPCGLHRSAYSR